jgi:hypothetical protein
LTAAATVKAKSEHAAIVMILLSISNFLSFNRLKTNAFEIGPLMISKKRMVVECGKNRSEGRFQMRFGEYFDIISRYIYLNKEIYV